MSGGYSGISLLLAARNSVMPNITNYNYNYLQVGGNSTSADYEETLQTDTMATTDAFSFINASLATTLWTVVVTSVPDVAVPTTSSTSIKFFPEEDELLWSGANGSNTNSTGYLDNLMVAVPMGVSLYALSLLTFVGNAMVLHAIRTERRLQTVSNMFIMSLAVADLTVGMIVMPVSSAYAITGEWRLGLVLCQFWLAADYTASTASILNLLILSLDRYWSIRHPLKYIRKRTKRRAIVMIAIVWLVSSMWIVPIIGWHYWNSNGIRLQPSNVCETEFARNVVFKLTASTINFYVPMVLMMALYAKIFYEIKKRSKFEIGQCNVLGGSGGGSTYDVSVRQDGKTIGLSRNSSKSSLGSNRIEEKPLKSAGRQYIYADYRSHNHVHHHQIEQVPPVERRYNRLTLLSLKSDGSEANSDETLQQNTASNAGPSGEKTNHKRTNHKKGGGGAVLKSKRSSSSLHTSGDDGKCNALITWLCPCVLTNEKGGQTSPSDSPTPENRKKPKRNVKMLDYDNGGGNQCRRTGSTTSRRLNNNLNALRMRVTRKTITPNLRQEKKAARQLGVIMGAFILCWLPYMIIFIVMACCEDCVASPYHTASIWLGYLNSFMNPFLYALCNRNFKRAFKNMFRRGSKSRHFLPQPNNAARTEHLFA